MTKGLFVTFEGGEGAGKSTLACALRDALKAQGRDVVFTREPGGTPFGEELRDLLLHSKTTVASRAELYLFLASRIQHIEALIKPSLERGCLVLCDRFTDSTIAYQGYARGLGADFVSRACAQATDNFEPDLTFYVDLDVNIGLQRRHQSSGCLDRLEAEDHTFHEKVREGFLALAKKHPKRIVTLDGTLDPEALFHAASSLLQKNLKSVSI